jgi:SSS family solute:Na+ symporter
MMGLFAAVIVACAISCDNSYLHSWGTIFVQDVMMPMRNKPLDPKRHLLWLRVSIISVALFGFMFSMLFPLKDFILMFFALTGAIYMGGAGAVILGGLYWKRGTTAAAWTALILGTIMAFGGMLIQSYWGSHISQILLNIWPNWQWVIAHKEKFPLDGQEIYFYAMISASLSYVLVSLLGPKQVFNMDKMLHRGEYAVKEDIVEAKDALVTKCRTFGEIIGVSREFSRFERFLFWATFWWTMLWWGIFVVGTVINLFYKVSDNAWSWFWWFKLWWFSLILGIVCTAWIFFGGIRDAFRLFHDLKSERVDESDDGTVKKTTAE